MQTIFGVYVVLVGLICWLGQSLSLFLPDLAVKLGVLEPEDEMDETLYIIEPKVLGIVDLSISWTLPAAAIMMLSNMAYWPVFALIGSGIYIYFSGIIVVTRIILPRFGKKAGSPGSRKSVYIASFLWILAAFGMIFLSVLEIYGQ